MPMNAKRPLRILLTGATGLVGQGVAKACLQSSDVAEVIALVRRPGSVQPPVAERVLVDFLQAEDHLEQLAGFDACFYCAGATPVGTPEAEYREVTLDTTLAVARAFAAANPQGMFLYVSGAHSSPESRIMPLRIKGETEVALARLPICTVMLRPGGVSPVEGTGTRHGALKPLYRFAGPVMKLAVKATPSLATSNLAIGQAMIALAQMEYPPAVVECTRINALAASA